MKSFIWPASILANQVLESRDSLVFCPICVGLAANQTEGSAVSQAVGEFVNRAVRSFDAETYCARPALF